MSEDCFDIEDKDLQSVDEEKGPVKKKHKIDILKSGSWDADDLKHSSAEQSNISWKDTPAAKKHRVLSDLTFEQWCGEELTALEQNVYSALSMPPDDYLLPSIQHLESRQPVDDNNDSSSEGEDEHPQVVQKRPSVREHSKAQREARKAFIKDLEEKASSYSAELTENGHMFREVLEKYAFRRKYCYETLCNFLDMWIHGEQNVEAWQVVVDQSIEMSIPCTTTRFRPPGQIVNCRRVMKGVSEIIADAISISVMCLIISNHGLVPISKFQLHVDVPLTNFIVEDDAAMADFNIYSKNATLCGGKYEIHLNGMLRCGFNHAGNLQWVDLCYNECNMQQQLLAAFGSDIYVAYPNIASMQSMMRQPASEAMLETTTSHLITTLEEQLLVTDMDIIATQRIGPVTGRSLVSADWVAGAVRVLSDWAPYSCQLDAASAVGQPTKIVCTLYPFCDDTAGEADSDLLQEQFSAGGVSPNRVLWTMRECPSIPDDVQITTMIRCVIQRIVESAKIRINCVDPSRCPNVLALLRQAAALFDESEYSPALGPADAATVLVDLMGSFLKWVEAIESSLWNLHQIEMLEACNDDDSLNLLTASKGEIVSGFCVPTFTQQIPNIELSPLEKVYYGDNGDESTCNVRSTMVGNKFDAKDGSGDSENIDTATLADMSSSLDMFFEQLRDPSICPHIIGLLRTVPNSETAQIVEEFYTYCQTKHSDPRIRVLMRDAQDLVRSHHLEKAIETLDEIIALDSEFVEAYNRRATANYGLRRAQACYSDLEQVLSRNPLHFGALCGKGLLMMNLKSYDLAAVAFQAVLYINPRLQNDEAILRNLRYCNHHIHTNFLDGNACVAATSVWTQK